MEAMIPGTIGDPNYAKAMAAEPQAAAPVATQSGVGVWKIACGVLLGNLLTGAVIYLLATLFHGLVFTLTH